MRIRRVYRVSLVLIALATVAVVLSLDALDALGPLDLASVDARFAIRGAEAPPRDVVVVGIDTPTFDYLDAHDPGAAHFPFRRRLDARVIDNLAHAGALVIAYDVQFTEQTDAVDDDDLIEAVRAAGNVVLGTTEVARGGATRILGGGEGLTYSRATPADTQLPQDGGGTIRRFSGSIQGLATFPVAVAGRALGRPVRVPGGRGATAWIDYPGPPGTIPSLSYWEVLEGRFPSGAVRGKVVVVGATAASLQDFHPTSAGGYPMPGPEIQAAAIETALHGFPLRSAPGWLDVALILTLGLMGPLAALRLRALAAAALTVGAVGALAVVCQLAFDAGRIVGFVYPALAALLATAAMLVVAGLRAAFEREQVRYAFARFVPESVVAEVLAEADGLRLGGVRREATVLFSDLRGFTTFAEQREPEETIEILNRYLTEMSDAILDHGGTLVGYMGDGIMAVFGAPIAEPDHARRALAAARAMLVRLEHFNVWLRGAGHGEGFKMGIGLNSGPVMSGNVGSERRLEYTTIGDTTNTAARLEGMTKGTPYQLYLSETTYAHLAEDPADDPPADLVSAGELEVRGRSGRVTIWALVEPSGFEKLKKD